MLTEQITCIVIITILVLVIGLAVFATLHSRKKRLDAHRYKLHLILDQFYTLHDDSFGEIDYSIFKIDIDLGDYDSFTEEEFADRLCEYESLATKAEIAALYTHFTNS